MPSIPQLSAVLEHVPEHVASVDRRHPRVPPPERQMLPSGQLLSAVQEVRHTPPRHTPPMQSASAVHFSPTGTLEPPPASTLLVLLQPDRLKSSAAKRKAR